MLGHCSGTLATDKTALEQDVRVTVGDEHFGALATKEQHYTKMALVRVKWRDKPSGTLIAERTELEEIRRTTRLESLSQSIQRNCGPCYTRSNRATISRK